MKEEILKGLAFLNAFVNVTELINNYDEEKEPIFEIDGRTLTVVEAKLFYELNREDFADKDGDTDSFNSLDEVITVEFEGECFRADITSSSYGSSIASAWYPVKKEVRTHYIGSRYDS